MTVDKGHEFLDAFDVGLARDQTPGLDVQLCPVRLPLDADALSRWLVQSDAPNPLLKQCHIWWVRMELSVTTCQLCLLLIHSSEVRREVIAMASAIFNDPRLGANQRPK